VFRFRVVLIVSCSFLELLFFLDDNNKYMYVFFLLVNCTFFTVGTFISLQFKHYKLPVPYGTVLRRNKTVP
jgi:hypothetical protein